MYFKTHWAAATASDIAAFVIGLGVFTTAAHVLPDDWWGAGWGLAEHLALVSLVAAGFGFGFKLIILDLGSPMTFCPTCGVHVEKRALGCWSCGDCFAPQRTHRARDHAQRHRERAGLRRPAPKRSARDLDRELERATLIVRERVSERRSAEQRTRCLREELVQELRIDEPLVRGSDADVLDLEDVEGVVELGSSDGEPHDPQADDVSAVFRESTKNAPARWPKIAPRH